PPRRRQRRHLGHRRRRFLSRTQPAARSLLSRNTIGGPRPRLVPEEPADTTVERRDHCADMVVSALRRCVDAGGKLASALNALARGPRERSLRAQRLLA